MDLTPQTTASRTAAEVAGLGKSSGARGGVNRGPTYSAAKKACDDLNGPGYKLMVSVQGL